MLQTNNIISKDIVNASEDYRINYTLIVERCIELRKIEEDTIQDTCVMLDISRQKYSRFERLEIHDMILASNILDFFGDGLQFTYKKERQKWMR